MPDTAEMKVRAIAPWFGGKRTLAPKIVEELGKHRAYWDVFCGSLAVPFAKEPSSFETVNDLHGDLINLARVLAAEDSAMELYSRASRMLMHEDFFHEAAVRYRERGNRPAGDLADLERAFDFFICSWMGRNGVAGTSAYNQGFCVRYTKNSGHAATRFQSCVKSIPAWHERLRIMTILNRDGLELLERIEDAPGVCIYCDPPYLAKGANYIHEFTQHALRDDHQRLATLLRRFKKTRVVMSYYEHPHLDHLYPGWTVRKVYGTKAMVNQGMRDREGATVAPEVLILNGPSYAGGE